MPVYEYIALDSGGRKRKGIVDAGSIAAANQKLRESEIYPEEIAETADRKREESAARGGTIRLFRKAGLRELASMTRQLATLIGAGLPLVPSLSALVTQITHPVLKTTLARIKEEVFMFFIGSGVLLFLVTFVVPNITNIFREMHQALPGITVFLIVVSGFLKSFWWIILSVLLAMFVSLRYAIRKTKRGRRWWDKFLLRVPLFGGLNRKIAVARFSRTLGTLLQSGVPLLSALDIAKNVVNNTLLAEQIGMAAKDVEEGQSLSSPLSKNGFFPSIAVEMIAAGEASGNMEAMLFRIADAYEKEVEANVLVVTSLLEPAMILMMGAVVGFIVVSILLPIFEMNQLVR